MKFSMKNFTYFFFICFVVFSGCTNEKPAENTEESTEQPTNSLVATPPNPTTPQESRIIRVLTTNYWIINAYVKIGDKEANRANQGKWYQFKDDGTYIVGQFSDTIGEGVWSFGYTELAGQIRLKSKNKEESLWNIQIGNDESIMIWVGTEEFMTTNIQMRLENLIFIPKNRKEMGLPE